MHGQSKEEETPNHTRRWITFMKTGRSRGGRVRRPCVKVDVFEIGGLGGLVSGTCTIHLIDDMPNGEYAEVLEDLWELLDLDAESMSSVR